MLGFFLAFDSSAFTNLSMTNHWANVKNPGKTGLQYPVVPGGTYSPISLHILFYTWQVNFEMLVT